MTTVLWDVPPSTASRYCRTDGRFNTNTARLHIYANFRNCTIAFESRVFSFERAYKTSETRCARPLFPPSGALRSLFNFLEPFRSQLNLSQVRVMCNKFRQAPHRRHTDARCPPLFMVDGNATLTSQIPVVSIHVHLRHGTKLI